MRVTTARRLRDAPVNCQRWADVPATATATELESSKPDRYSAFIRGAGYESPEQTFERAADLVLRYQIFPPELVAATVCTPDGKAVVGAGIVQRSFAGPLAVESAVRVVDIVDEPTYAGRRFALTLVTLKGHPLRGVETIALLLHENGRIELTFTSTSRPSGFLTQLGEPLTRLLQRRATLQALTHFRLLVADTAEPAPAPFRGAIEVEQSEAESSSDPESEAALPAVPEAETELPGSESAGGLR